MRYYIGLDDEQPEPLGLHMDFLIHFERLSDDFKEVCDRLHIECGTIKHLNKSSRQHYSSYYDVELMDLVRDRFAEDVAFGNYSFDS